MQKDVIYIDVDDDITAIIGKIKASKEKIVALVPPKHVGVLQSAVNLRLLERMAKNDKKHLVIITNNPALMGLTASARIPVAKNLQSKPEIAEIPALKVDDADDIIDGADLPVGDHARGAAKGNTSSSDASPLIPTRPTRDAAIQTIEIDNEVVGAGAVTAVAASTSMPLAKTAKGSKSKVKIPNFNSFRKRFVFGAIGLVGLVVLLVWMFAIAPAATITITANTSPSPVSATVKLGGSAVTDAKAGVINSTSQQLKKDASVEVTPTGKVDKGEKASGQVVFQNCESASAITIAAGTVLTSQGTQYTTTAAVTVPGANIVAGGNGKFCVDTSESAAVGVTASQAGPASNRSDNTTFSVAGREAASSSTPGGVYFRGVAEGAIAGGTTREVPTVTNEDVERAVGQLVGQSTDSLKAQLKKQFKNGEIVIDGSFTVEKGDTKVTPAQGEEVAEGAKATLTVPMTYTMQAFTKQAVATYLDAEMKTQLEGEANQQVYNNGIDKVAFGNFQKAEDGTMTVTLTTTGQIGPKIDKSAIKEQIKGKITGDVQGIVEAIDGVSQVDVDYSYLWVRTVPTDTNKIQVEFKLQDD